MSSLFDIYIYFIILVKILFVLLIVASKHAVNSKKDPKTIATLTLWKERMEFIFIVTMALLCIVVFNPFRSGPFVLQNHVRVLLFIYGFIILLNADWGTYFPKWFYSLKEIIKPKA